MAGQLKLALVILAVDDLARAARFYNTILQCEPTVVAPVYTEYELANHMRLGLYQATALAQTLGVDATRVGPSAVFATELYCYAEDVNAVGARVLSAGGKALSPLAPRPWGDEVAYFEDLDGNVLALARGRTSA